MGLRLSELLMYCPILSVTSSLPPGPKVATKVMADLTFKATWMIMKKRALRGGVQIQD